LVLRITIVLEAGLAAEVIEAIVNAITAPVQTGFDSVSSAIKTVLYPIAADIQPIFNPIALEVQPLGQLFFAMLQRFFRSVVETLIDPLASAVQPLVANFATMV